jgi:glyoxylase-like metal-dependent hydrolase (beta-lactamase superfamily II)
MDLAICITCGTQYGHESQQECPICLDERQYVNVKGQQWTSMRELAHEHRNTIRMLDENLYAIETEPSVAIGQHAFLIRTPHGNVLWESLSYLDAETIEAVQALGGIQAIAISHPHFYSAMVEWSHAFDAPIYLHADNQPYVMRPDPSIKFWQGEQLVLNDAITLVRCGGHFAGSSVLHWSAGANGKGALFTGDTIMVVPDRRFVSFMYSYPNLIPMNAQGVQRIVDAVEPFAFDQLYSSWDTRVVQQDAKAAVKRSAERYIAHIRD